VRRPRRRASHLFGASHPQLHDPTDAVRAFMHMVRYQKNQQMLTETPPSIPEAFSPTWRAP